MDPDSTRTNIPPVRAPVLERRDTEATGHEIRPIWTTLMEEMLIHYIRANRLLWDPKHPHFTKPIIKRRKVEDIAAIIKREAGITDDIIFTPEDVWRKFRNLRTFFVREVRKVNERKRQLNEEPYESKWVHFNRMLFLVDSLKKSIEACVPLPGVGTNPALIKQEGTRVRVAVNSLATLNNLQQRHQETENELRVGGEWEDHNSRSPSIGDDNTEVPVAGPSFATSVDRNCDRVISRSSSRVGSKSKKTKLTPSQENKLLEISDAFGKFITASVRRYPEDKQHDLMANITKTLSEFHNKQ